MRSAQELYAVLLYKPIAMTVNKTDQVLFHIKHKTPTWWKTEYQYSSQATALIPY